MATELFQKSTDEGKKESSTTDVAVAKLTFEHHIKKERERLTNAREALIAERSGLDEKIKKLETELNAIDAYEAAKNGRAPRKRKSGSGRRNEVLEAIQKHPQGISRNELLNVIGANDTEGKKSLTSVLSGLKRSKKITQDGDGKYHVPTIN